jgi:uncharacterized protein YjdB
MKKNIFFIIAFISMLMLGMTACNEDDALDAPYFTLGVDGQTYAPASLILNTDTYTQVFSVKSNGSWKIIPRGESTSWATISPDHGEKDGSFTLSVERNIYTVDRSMELAFQVNNKELRCFYVSQPAFGPEIIITTNPDPVIIEEDDIITFNISTNADLWEYSNTSDWLTEVEKNATMLKLKVTETLSEEMVDTVRFTLPDYPSVVQKIAVKKRVPLTGIILSDYEIDLIVGDVEEMIVPTPIPANATEVDFVWTSDDPDIATVSRTGTITATGYGTTTITVSSNGIETTLTVNVKLKLFNRPIIDSFLDGTDGKINWGTVTDPFMIWTEVRYINTLGEEIIVQTPATESVTYCPDVHPGEPFEIRTAFSPNGGVDVFTTSWVISQSSFLPMISGDYTVLSSSWIADYYGGIDTEYSGSDHVTITATGIFGEYELSDFYGGCYGEGLAPGTIKFDGYEFSLVYAEDPYGYGFGWVYGSYDDTTKTIYLEIDWDGYIIYLYLQKNP